MRILFLAPQPFYEERGTPIAVDLVLQGLSERGETVDLVTFHLGEDVLYENVTIHRTLRIPLIKRIPPGFSLRKVICDILMFFQAFPLLLKRRYQYIHAVEEAVFIALVLRMLFKIPYVYDMDSSLSQQMTERYPRFLPHFAFILNYFERIAIRHAKAVVPVCDALREDVEKFSPTKVLVLRDVSLLKPDGQMRYEDLRAKYGIKGPLMMYIGNLESYQGIDLLLQSFSLVLKRTEAANLVIIGGKDEDISKYRGISERLGIKDRVHFLGPKPVERLSGYLSQADILVSPRIKGKNTPMKIYSYLDSGKALVATNLPTHTQVLNAEVAVLAEPNPNIFSNGVLQLMEDKNLRQKLARSAKELIEERHTVEVFKESLNALYDWLMIEADRESMPAPVFRPDQ